MGGAFLMSEAFISLFAPIVLVPDWHIRPGGSRGRLYSCTLAGGQGRGSSFLFFSSSVTSHFFSIAFNFEKLIIY